MQSRALPGLLLPEQAFERFRSSFSRFAFVVLYSFLGGTGIVDVS